MDTIIGVLWMLGVMLLMWLTPRQWRRSVAAGLALVVVASVFAPVWAQDVAAEKPSIWMLLLEAGLKVLPTILSFFSSYVTHALQYVHGAIPTKALPVVSGVLGVLVSAISAVFLGAPAEQIEVYSGTGLVAGLAGHAVKQAPPIPAAKS